ncbi:MAG: serine/threonine-protein kinase, partial [Acidobacteriota bacterium]
SDDFRFQTPDLRLQTSENMSRANLVNTSIGEYRVVDFLGAGGMGEVYRAVHSKIGRVVAVKLLTQTVRNSTFVERFLNEARIQANLNHPNIVTLYDFLEVNGQPCIVMEYIEGQSLDEMIKARGMLSAPEALRIFQSAVEAIEYVHIRGIVHRDIKSSNIRISNAGEVKLLDFGIAKSGETPQLTVTGAFIGTLQYLSPEQITGGVADFRSDIWALGVLLYEMVTGKLPFEAVTLGELCEKISKSAHISPASFNSIVPHEVEAIINRCLKKNAQERYSSASELLQDVRRAVASLSDPLSSRTFTSLPPQRVSAPYQMPQQTAPPQVYQHTAPVQSAPTALEKKSKMPMILIAVAVAAIIIVGSIFAIMNFSGGNPSGNVNQSQGGQTRGDGAQRTVKIDAVGGMAEVYINNERRGTTPYQFQAKVRDQFDVMLKREGFNDKQFKISVNDTGNEYTYMLEKRR